MVDNFVYITAKVEDFIPNKNRPNLFCDDPSRIDLEDKEIREKTKITIEDLGFEKPKKEIPLPDLGKDKITLKLKYGLAFIFDDKNLNPTRPFQTFSFNTYQFFDGDQFDRIE